MAPQAFEQVRKALKRDVPTVEAVAYSADGRAFGYEAPVSADIQVGGWVTLDAEDGSSYLGQVTTEEIAASDASSVKLDLDADATRPRGSNSLARGLSRARARHTVGTGVVLAKRSRRGFTQPGTRDTFAQAAISAADGATVASYLSSAGGAGARLPIGSVQRCTDSPDAFLRAAGFDRHTFLCGQSGSVKTYSLGAVLEQLLLYTDLRIIVIDANSDYVRLAEVRAGVPSAAATEYRRRLRRFAVLRPGSFATSERTALRAWFSDLAEPEQAAVLRMDPLADREEYHALSSIGDDFGSRRYSLADVLQRASTAGDEGARQLALRIRNLRVSDWMVWARGRERSSAEYVRNSKGAIVFDVGTLAAPAEKAVVSAALLGGLWRLRERRQPTLIVIDEAHNVCPDDPPTALHANATEYCINIAAEGRKFGLYLLLSTQRPQKIHHNVLSQCDNLMLMRMNSRADLAELSQAFSFVPRTLLEEAVHFRQGEALIAGRIVPAPLIARVSGRMSEEGGADLPATWARRKPARKPAGRVRPRRK
jgi:hypothetical protein